MIYMVVAASLKLPLETKFDAVCFGDIFTSQQTYFSEARISARLLKVQQLHQISAVIQVLTAFYKYKLCIRLSDKISI